MTEKKSNKKILKLNKAWTLIRKGLTIIKECFPNDNDMNYFWIRLNKANDRMQSFIYKKLQSDYIYEESNKLIKKLKDK